MVGVFNLKVPYPLADVGGVISTTIYKYMMAEVVEDSVSKVIQAAKKGWTADVLRLLRKDEAICVAARDKVKSIAQH